MASVVEIPLTVPPVDSEPAPITVVGLFRQRRRPILAAYALFTVDNLGGLGTPWILGMAIGGLCQRSWRGLALLFGLQLFNLTVDVVRRMYDARLYTAVYADLARRLVLGQRGNAPLSSLAARSSLAQQLIDFLERDLPTALHTLFGVAGALVMLALADGWLLAACVAVTAPAVLAGRAYSRRTRVLNARLHDEMEREVALIASGTAAEVGAHYRRLGGCRVRLADLQAVNVGFMQACSMGLMAVALARTFLIGEIDVGRIAMTLGYVALFIQGLVNFPLLVELYGRLRDIGRRVRGEEPAGSGPAAEENEERPPTASEA